MGAYPSRLNADVREVLNLVPMTKLSPSDHDIGPLRVAGEALHIPFRVYFPEPDYAALDGLSETQKTILSALYTRHHNGFIRERRVLEIVASPATWVVPFVLQLIGEYVIEIIRQLADRREQLQYARYACFIDENPEFVALTCRRVVSYWECYFRESTPVFSEHVAYRLAKDIGLWRKSIAPRLEEH
jgi:hypothetical protein